MNVQKICKDAFILLAMATLFTGCVLDEETKPAEEANVAPMAIAQSVTAAKDMETTITLTGSDANGDSLTYNITTGPVHGTLSGSTPTKAIYTPESGYTGSDSFTFTVSDGMLSSAPATIDINVTDSTPPAPANVSAFSGDHRVTLSWDAAVTADSYNIYWSLSPGALNGTKVSTANSPFYHTSLNNDTNYYYVVTAVNSMGEGAVSDEVMATPTDIISIADLNFVDPNLQACVNDTNATYISELITLKCTDKNISNLYGIEQLSGLVSLHLDRNMISDIGPLAPLSSLSILLLDENTISDVSPLENLVNLSELYLDINTISNISPLTNLTNLFTLDLYTNTISDISPLVNLTGLKWLDLYDNNISDVSPLTTLTKLIYLGLDENIISNVTPLSTLTNLLELYLNDNSIGGENIGNVDVLSVLGTATTIDLTNNPQISCHELQTLIDSLTAGVVDPYTATDGITCTAP